jgi:phosphate butyryltransferase
VEQKNDREERIMLKSIQQIFDRVPRGGGKVLSVAAAQDEDVLRAVTEAARMGIIQPILVGDGAKIERILNDLGENAGDYRIKPAIGADACAREAVRLTASGRADFLMKGMIGTADLLRAVLDRQEGLRSDKLISHAMLYEVSSYPKLLAVTDGGVNPYPDREKKAAILSNAAEMLSRLGYEEIVAACVCGAEIVDPKIQSTVDAEAIAQMTRWQSFQMKVIGPVGLDLAISKESCRRKGYSDPSGGEADILLAPSYEVGNAVGKTLAYFAGARSAGIILGARTPIVMVSRSGNAKTKLSSIALGCLLCP